MQNLKGFWSYVHDDDKAEKGRITQLAHDIVEQYGLVTGDRIDLFLDKDDLNWGDKWKDKIDNNLASIAFFIPVLTPRYLMSAECRREMQYFISRASASGISELLLPLLYINIPQLNDTKDEDELIKIIKNIQYEDWTEIRFSNISSEEYRRAVFKLTKKLVEANKKSETFNVISPNNVQNTTTKSDEEPGFIDLLAKMEDTIPEWNDTITQLSKEIEKVGTITKEETANANEKNTGDTFSKRLGIMRRLANRLSEPTENIWQLSNKNAVQVNNVDAGLRILLEKAPTEINTDPTSKEKYKEFITAMKILINSAKESFISVEGMIKSLAPIETISREIRPVIRKMKQGLIIFSQTKAYFYEWGQLIDSFEKGLV